MTLLIIFIVGIVVMILYIVGSSQEKNNAKNAKQNLHNKKSIDYEKEKLKEIRVPSVKSIVKKIKNREDIIFIENEIDKWFDKYQKTDFSNSKYEKLFNNYEDAIRIIYYETLYYQYVPEIELTSPQKLIDNAYRVVSADDFKQINKEIGGILDDWIEIKGMELMEEPLENLIEQKPEYWNSLIKFRQIVNDKISYLEKVEKINKLTLSDKIFTEEFFFLDEGESAGEFWIKSIIKSYGVPLVDKLYEMGFDTPDKYVNLNIEEIKNIKGFGSHRIKQLNKAIKEIKNNNLGN